MEGLDPHSHSWTQDTSTLWLPHSPHGLPLDTSSLHIEPADKGRETASKVG